jgi:hypothetical protein
VAGAGDRDEGAVGERDADGFALAAVDGAVAEVAAGDAADRRTVEAVRAGAVAVDERAITRSPMETAVTSSPTSSTTPMNSWPIDPTAWSDSPR